MRFSRRDFLAASVAAMAVPGRGARSGGAAAEGCRDRRGGRGRGRHRRGAAGAGGEPQGCGRRGRPTGSAGAAGPIPKPSACRSIAARAGSIRRTPIRSRGWRARWRWMSTPRRRRRRSGSDGATRAPARPRIFLQRSSAPIARSATRIARRMSRRWTRCRRIPANGRRRWNSRLDLRPRPRT